jgi:lysophospholipase L1-like esterase
MDTAEEGAYGRVSTEQRRAYGRNVSRFEVYYYKQPDGGSFDVLIDGRRVERIDTDAEVAGPGYAVYEVEDGPHQLEVRARGDGTIRIFGVSLDREAPGVRLDTVGINGSRARFHLLWHDGVYREHLARREPDLVVLAYGTNEAGDSLSMEAYADHLRRVIRRVQEVAPESSCLLLGPTDRPINQGRGRRRGPYVDRPRTASVNEAQRLVSQELGCGYFDLVAFMGGPMSMVDWVAADPPHGARDHIHLTRHGYQRLAEEFLAALIEYHPAAPESEGGESAAPAPETDSSPGGASDGSPSS